MGKSASEDPFLDERAVRNEAPTSEPGVGASHRATCRAEGGEAGGGGAGAVGGVGGAAHGRGRTGDRLREHVKDDEPAVEHQPERRAALLLRPAGLEDVAEHKGENGQHDQRVEKHPQHAEHGAPVAEQHVALDELPQKIALGDHAFCDA